MYSHPSVRKIIKIDLEKNKQFIYFYKNTDPYLLESHCGYFSDKIYIVYNFIIINNLFIYYFLIQFNLQSEAIIYNFTFLIRKS